MLFRSLASQPPKNMDKQNSNSNKNKPHAILIPLPLQGHVTPFVQLAIKLASKGFSITFINSNYIHHQITLSNPTSTSDIFAGARKGSELDIEYVTVSDGLPLEYDRSLNHEHWVGANMHCFPAHVEVVVSKIAKSRPSVCYLIADTYSAYASKMAKKYGMLHGSFWTEAAMVLAFYFHTHLLKENGHIGPATGILKKILRKEKGGYEINIVDPANGREMVDIIPPGPELLISEGESIKLDQQLTSNPNVGGFGQEDAEIVLQDPLRVQGTSAPNDIIEYIPGIRSIKRTDLTSYLQEEDMTTIEHRCLFAAIDDTKQADFVLCNTVQELEAHTISALQAQTPFYAIGPLFPHGFVKGPVATSLWAESDCTQWLDSKPNGSVLYVSFGSYAHITKEELAEIANGIKLSGVNFLWVIRPDMVSSEDQDVLPIGFRDEVSDRGMIVTWTCQIAVLSHRAIGGFLTHCGWNSILESIWCEVPLLCFPLLTDQFTNRKLVVDDWGIGRNLCEEKPIKSEEVLQKVFQLISGSLCSEFKDKIKGLKGILENAMAVDGSSQRNLDTFAKALKMA